MAKLTKAAMAAHERACALLAEERLLTIEERIDIIDNWHEGAAHLNTRASAHFTPWDYARHVALEGATPKLLDLCAGIGTLAFACAVEAAGWGDPDEVSAQMTLVEINPAYAAVARRLLPRAEVIVGSIYDTGLQADLASRGFDAVVSNPPFGSISKGSDDRAPRYTGKDAHYAIIDIASDLACYGVFVLPQQACPFRYSGRQTYDELRAGENRAYDKFKEQTGIELTMNCGIDTTALPAFRGVGITTEIALAEFEDLQLTRRAAANDDCPLFTALAA